MDESFERAMSMRRAVLGDDYVDAVMAKTTPVSASFQEFVTRWAWGEAWLDGALEPQLRSLLTLAVVTTLGQRNEIRLHVAGALRNGCTPEQIAAALKHVAIYAGVARAVAGIGIADEEIAAFAAAPAPADGAR